MFWYLLYKLGQFLVYILPQNAAYRLSDFVSNLQYRISTKDRLTVINNLNAIGIKYASGGVEECARQVFCNFGRYLVDFFRSSNMGREDLKKIFRIEGLSYIDEALKKGRGVIVLSAHIGNWEIGGIGMAALGYPISAVALDHKNDRVNSIFVRSRSKWGIDVIPLSVAAKRSYISLRSNRMLAILGDRDFSNSGLISDFLGKKAILPKGPAMLSLRTGAPIVPGFILMDGTGKYIINFEEPIWLENTSHDLEADMRQLTERCAKAIERYIRQYPTQWLMFHKFWI